MAGKFTIFLQLVLLSLPLSARPLAETSIMSHRGVFQTYPRPTGPDRNERCTAETIYPPTHSYLENTIPSIRKAFELNADAVEIDVHSTSDGKVVVFHDWELECRTNGSGVTQEQSFDYLRSLDIGYGYTADDHQGHPFRCKPGSTDYKSCMKRNQMPSLREVLEAFPGHRLIINMKSASLFTLKTLVAEFREIREELNYDLSKIFFYSGKPDINKRMKELVPEIETPALTISEIEACLKGYFATGAFAAGCRNAVMALPFEQFAKLPVSDAKKLIQDSHEANNQFGLIRVDTPEAAAYVEKFSVDVIWTDRIELVGPLVSFGRVDQDLKAYDEHVRALKKSFESFPADPNDKEWVKTAISHMVEVDQHMRLQIFLPHEKNYTEKELRHFQQEFSPRREKVDRENTTRLKELLKLHGWLKISVFGEVTDNEAWLLVQHADHDPDFQREVLAILEKLYRTGETNPSNYAYLFDRVAASWSDPSQKKLQRYGTQGTCLGPNRWEPIPMEEPKNLDIRRAEVGLMPFEKYRERVKTMCK